MVGRSIAGSRRGAGRGVSRPGTSSVVTLYYLKDREGVIPFERQ